jgi:hypothetical protein
MNKENWWYGCGEIGSIVFDSSIQLNDHSVLLFVLEENDVKKYLADEVRLMLKKETDDEKIKKLEQKYESWRKFYSSKLKYLASEKPYSFQEVKDRAESEHKKRLEKLGLPYKGVNQNPTKEHRATYCYACGENLDSAIDLECVACGWILCKCGACGCGFTREI